MRPRLLPLLFVSMIALASAGCTQPQPVHTTSSPTADPTAGDEALEVAAAEEVYLRYLNAGLAMLESGEVSPSAYSGIATPEQAELSIADTEATLAQGFRAAGRYEIARFEVQEQNADDLVAFVCIDNSSVELAVDDVWSPASPADPLRVRFETVGTPLVDFVDAIPSEVNFSC